METPKKKKINKTLIVVIVILLLPILILEIGLVIDMTETPNYEVRDNNLNVSCLLYSKSISLDNAIISLETEPLQIKRMAGTGTKSLKKGVYNDINLNRQVYANIINFGEKYIKIDNGEIAYLNLKSNLETELLYSKLEELANLPN